MVFKLYCVRVLFPRKFHFVLTNKINLSLQNPKIHLSDVAPERELGERTVGT